MVEEQKDNLSAALSDLSEDEVDPEFMLLMKEFSSAAVARLTGAQPLLRKDTSVGSSRFVARDSKF